MKPRLIDRSNEPGQLFSIRQNRYPNFLKIWHYHPELELVVIKQSTGTRFVGNSIEKFEPGEVVLLGKKLPHMWLNDPAYFNNNETLFAEAICIHFKEDFTGQSFLELPDAAHLLELFERAKRGIRFLELNESVIHQITSITTESDGFTRLVKLLQILHLLAKHQKFQLLSSDGYLDLNNFKSGDKTHEFIFKNFDQPIQLADVAKVAEMNPSAFSRYFKRIHRKTFSRYLIEIRIGYACKLLMEDNSSISAACYRSGFNNLSNFNKQFKRVMNMNPTEYIRLHK